MRCYLFFRFLFIVICILVEGCYNLVLAKNSRIIPKVDKGLLDCKNWDFHTDGNIKMEGEWEFYWNALYSPKDFENDQLTSEAQFPTFPQLWTNINQNGGFLSNQGFATYRLKIISDQPLQGMALEIPDFYSSSRLWVNGELIAENGHVGTSRNTSTPHWLPQIKSILLTQPVNEIILQISNFHHFKGGSSKNILFGMNDNLENKHKVEFASILLLTGALIMGFLFFLGLYLFGRNEKAGLYFSLFCLVYTYRIIGTNLYVLHDLFPQLDWVISTKLEYITLFLSVSFFLEFIKRVFVDEFHSMLIRIAHIINGTLTFVTIFLSAQYYTQVINPYLILLVLLILYGAFILIRALINKKEGADFAVLSFVALFLTFNLVVLDYFNISKFTAVLSFIGYILFFFFQALILSKRFAVSFNKAVKAAEEGSRIKSDFLATMSHEIRTPMNGMIGMTSLLSQTNLTEEQRKFTDTIRLSGENLMTIINDILDFSKIESQNMELECQLLEIKGAVTEIVDLFSLQASRNGLIINYQIEAGVPAYVIGDVTRLKQVIINLVNNAIKFTEEGEITIRVSKEAIQDKENSVQLRFEIEDTGIGIDASKMNRLFAPFSQVDSSIARKYGGTGLGLAICQKLVYLMGGDIWVESEEGKGTLILFNSAFQIPSESEIESQRPKPTVFVESSEKLSVKIPLRILVVEDNAINLQLVLFILKKEGYAADTAGNGQEAVDAVDRQVYDIVLMDMQMPVMDGLEASQRIVAKYSEENRPIIIALTANAMKEDKDRCFESGMVDFITKPLKPGIVRETLIKWSTQIQLNESKIVEPIQI
ncbi:MAG: signal transduction histidine kinase/ActR/RegA family two-component response regulator [Ulvibacter sp.]|jgi:signal transduction histidine kinase/ActR/RegA family two-component response regulator